MLPILRFTIDLSPSPFPRGRHSKRFQSPFEAAGHFRRNDVVTVILGRNNQSQVNVRGLPNGSIQTTNLGGLLQRDRIQALGGVSHRCSLVNRSCHRNNGFLGKQVPVFIAPHRASDKIRAPEEWARRIFKENPGPKVYLRTGIFNHVGSGGWIRTNDLWVMSPASYRAAPPRVGRLCDYRLSP